MDFRNVFDLAASLVVVLFFILCWGRFKRKMARKNFEKGVEYIRQKEYKDAIRLFQNIGDELKYDEHYWYYLAVALAGAGACDDAKKVLMKSLGINADNKMARDLLKQLDRSRGQIAPQGPKATDV